MCKSIPTWQQRRSTPAAGKFAVPWNTQHVFRALIADELGRGELTKTKYKRIVQYAAHFGVNAVQVGRIVQEIRAELEEKSPRQALRVVPVASGKPPRSALHRCARAFAVTVTILGLILWAASAYL